MTYVRRVLLSVDLLVHERTRVNARATLCGLPIVGARIVDSMTTCPTCVELVAVRAATLQRAPRVPLSDVIGEDEPEMIVCDLRCTSCGHVQTEELDGDQPARTALAAVTCACCGRVGRFTFAPMPMNDPVERPPHPEEP